MSAIFSNGNNRKSISEYDENQHKPNISPNFDVQVLTYFGCISLVILTRIQIFQIFVEFFLLKMLWKNFADTTFRFEGLVHIADSLKLIMATD